MWLSVLLVFAGLAMLIAGGDALVRGASALARRMGISPVVIGMTIVAFGTSTPELVINLTAAVKGTGDIGFGNIVGSNIANIALLLGITAMIRPLIVHTSIVTREMPMMVLAALAAIVLGLDDFFLGRPSQFDRADGLILLLLFGVFLYYTIMDVVRQRQSGDAFMEEAGDLKGPSAAQWGVARSIVFIIIGLAVVMLGGKVTVDSAVKLAGALGVPEVIVGLTIVAVGTSLPELATSLVAARRGQSDIAVGNIVGSNIYNLLFIMGLSSTIQPVTIPPAGPIDLLVMAGVSLLLLPLAITHKRTLTRGEGALLLTIYAGYVAWLVVQSLA